MVQYNPLQYLPTEDDLPYSDGKPADSQLQLLIANLLEDILARLWGDRTDWFWGINMGVYYQLDKPAIAPDGFLSLGVQRIKRSGGRLSYVIWQEGKTPIFAFEFVSKKYNQEYETKKDTYQSMGVLYYVVYNPQYYKRHKHKPFEVYRLENEKYVQQQISEPYWMPEIGLGIGRGIGSYRAWTREWLYWYDQNGHRLVPPSEIATEILRANQERQRAEQQHQRAEQEHQRADQERQRAEQQHQRAEQEHQRADQERQRADQQHQRAEQLVQRLREMGIDPNTLS